jgi:hypothetical protein
LSQHRSVSTPSAYPFPTPKCQYGRIPFPTPKCQKWTRILSQHRSVRYACPFPTPKCQYLDVNLFPTPKCQYSPRKGLKCHPLFADTNRTRAYKSFSQHPRGVSVSVLGLVSAYLYPLLAPPGAPFRGYDRSWVCSL